jgi:predicted GTPase
MPGADQGKSTEAHRDEIQDYLKNKDELLYLSKPINQ